MRQLLLAKYISGKSFAQLGKELGVTNLYAAQLLHNQVIIPTLGQACASKAGTYHAYMCDIGYEVMYFGPCQTI